MKRVTVKDIARESGYSVATVSKALSGTDRVGAETIEKIKKIAAELGYRSSLSAQALVRRTRRVAIVLFRSPAEVRIPFEKGFEDSFDLYREFGLEPEYHLFDHMNEVDWEAVAQSASAAIVTPGLGYEECADALDRLGRRIPLVILQTRTHQPVTQLCEVTVNARVVGMMAAQLLSLCAPGGRIGVLTGYNSGWIHDENVRGFLSAASSCGIEHAGTLETFDDMDAAYAAASGMLEDHPDLNGFFVTSYVSPAVCRAVADSGRQVHVVGVDLFAGSIACLRSGIMAAAIFQNQHRQAQLALEAVVNHLRGIAPEACIQVKPELVLRTNLSCYD